VRYVHPALGTFEGSPEEIARAVALLTTSTTNHASGLVQAAARNERPSNEKILHDWQHERGVSKAVRVRYTNVAREFEEMLRPKSLLDASQSDVRRYEARLLLHCTHEKWTNFTPTTEVVPRVKCMLGVFPLSPGLPAECGPSCALFERQSVGPRAKLSALKAFYDHLRERELVATNPVELVLRRHSKLAAVRSDDLKKYAPHVEEARAILWALKWCRSPRDVAIVMALAKWGRRPAHTLLLDADDLRGVLTPDPEGYAFADFTRVKKKVLAENGDGSTKLKGGLISPIDAEFLAYLREVYMPYRLAKWGFAWNEGALFPGDISGTSYHEKQVQSILDAAMRHLSKTRATAAERDAWKKRVEATDLRERITPGSWRHFFSTTLAAFGATDLHIDVLRGDRISGSKAHYMHVDRFYRDIVAQSYKMPALLSP